MRMAKLGRAVALGALGVGAFGTVGVSGAAAESHLAGYRTYVKPAIASSTFTVPAIDCSPVAANGFEGVVLGSQLYFPAPSGSTLSTGVGVAIICAPTPTYEAFGQINGASETVSLTVQPGDTITESAAEDSTDTTLAIADNNDNGGEGDVINGTGGTPTWAGVGAISVNCTWALGPCSPVPELSSPVTFSGVGINFKGPLGALAFRSNITSQSGPVQISASPLGRGLRSFTDTWVSSCGAGSARC